jgi:hypothetical protein
MVRKVGTLVGKWKKIAEKIEFRGSAPNSIYE